MSALFKLNSKDFIKGLVVAVFSAIVTWLATVVNVPGFDLASLDWQEIVKIAVIAGVSYLSKNLLTDDRGQLVGVV